MRVSPWLAAAASFLLSTSAAAVPIRLDFVGIDWFKDDLITGYLEFDTDEGVEIASWFPTGNYRFEGGSTLLYIERSDGRTATGDTFELSFANDQLSRPVFCGSDDLITWDGLWFYSSDLMFNILDCSAEMFGPEVSTLEDAVANPLSTGDGLFQWELRHDPGVGGGFQLLSLSTPIMTLFQLPAPQPEPEPTIVPEPGLVLLLGTGLALTLVARRKTPGPVRGKNRPGPPTFAWWVTRVS